MQKKLLSRSFFWRNCVLLNKSAPENAKGTSHFAKNIHHSSSSAKLFFLRKIRVWEQPQKLNQSQIANLTTSRFVWGILVLQLFPIFAKLLLFEQIRGTSVLAESRHKSFFMGYSANSPLQVRFRGISCWFPWYLVLISFFIRKAFEIAKKEVCIEASSVTLATGKLTR